MSLISGKLLLCFFFSVPHPFLQDLVGSFGLVLPPLNDAKIAFLGRDPGTMPVLVPAVVSGWGSHQWAEDPPFCGGVHTPSVTVGVSLSGGLLW